jgi:hypothetical protein
MTLVGLEGGVHREVKAQVRYAFDAEPAYDGILTIMPSTGEVVDPPELALCSKSGRDRTTTYSAALVMVRRGREDILSWRVTPPPQYRRARLRESHGQWSHIDVFLTPYN